MTGVLVTGPLMPWEQRQRVRDDAQQRANVRVLDFVPEPIALIERADRVIAMGGYNTDRKSTRLNSSHSQISYAVFCLKKKKNKNTHSLTDTEMISSVS